MRNRLTIKFKNNDTLITSIEGWNPDIAASEGWNTLFDWYRYSADPSFVFTDEAKASALLTKDNIFVMYAEIVPDNKPQPTAQPKSGSWFERVFNS